MKEHGIHSARLPAGIGGIIGNFYGDSIVIWRYLPKNVDIMIFGPLERVAQSVTLRRREH